MKKSRRPSDGKLVVAAILLLLAVANLFVNLKAAPDFVKPPDVTSRLVAITLAFLSVAGPLIVAALIVSRELSIRRQKKDGSSTGQSRRSS